MLKSARFQAGALVALGALLGYAAANFNVGSGQLASADRPARN